MSNDNQLSPQANGKALENSQNELSDDLNSSKPPVSPKHKSVTSNTLFNYDIEPSTPKRLLSNSRVSVISSEPDIIISYVDSDRDALHFKYPASCTHTARLTNKGYAHNELPKAVSTQDLTSFNKDRAKMSRFGKRSSSKNSASQKSFWNTLKRETPSHLGGSDAGSSSDSHNTDGSLLDVTDNEETFYRSFEDITFDDIPEVQMTSSGQAQADKCIQMKSSYNGDVWREVGYGGGVVQVPGSDVSLHVLSFPSPSPGICQSCKSILTKSESIKARKLSSSSLHQVRGRSSSAALLRKMSKSQRNERKTIPKLIDYDCPTFSSAHIDGKLVIGLQDPPDCMLLSNRMENMNHGASSCKLAQTFILAGPAIRLEVKDKRCIEGGAILHLPTDTVLKSNVFEKVNRAKSETDKMTTFACLQSTSYYGPYRELKSCYQYGNSLQVTLDSSQIMSSTLGKKGCEVHIVPVVSQAKSGFSLASLWEGVSRKTFHLGVYGPRYTYGRSTFCLSLSSSGFCPPFLKIHHDKLIHLTLRLLTSYILVVHKVQGFKMSMRTSLSSSFSLETDLADCCFTEEEIRTESRVNRIFILKHVPLQSFVFKSPSTAAGNKELVLQLQGLSDKTIHNIRFKTPKLKMHDYPRNLSPGVIERLVEREETTAMALCKSKLHDLPYQWILCQQEERSHFQDDQEIPGSNKKIFGMRLALTLKTGSIKTRNTSPDSPLVLQCPTDQYLPVLSRHTIWMNDGTSGKKEWWICYHQHRIGLIRTNLVHILEYKEYSTWNKVQMAVSKLVEAATSPIQYLKADQKLVAKKLAEKVENWSRFSAALRFGQHFVNTTVQTETDSTVRNEKIQFFIEKFSEYCTTSFKNRLLHHDAIRALLYTEQRDLAIELVTDCYFLTAAAELVSSWRQLAEMLVGKSDLEAYTNDCSSDTSAVVEESWRPAYIFLRKWRERFGENHKGALLGLHQAMEGVLHPPNTTLQLLLHCVIFVRCLDTLVSYDTKL